MTRKQLIALLVTAAALAAAVIGAWALDYSAREADSVDYSISVVSDEDVLATFDLAALEGLGTRRVWMLGELQEGPTLVSVLESAGVTEYDSVTVLGEGVRDSGRIVLSAEEIDDDVLLDFAVRGTVKLTGPEIPWEDRVRDVERIEVR